MIKDCGFFSVERGLLHSDRWLSEPFTRGQAWVDLFGLAQFEKSFFRIRGIRVDLERGQLGYSQVSLAKRWRWSRGKVIRFLNELENGGDIVQQNNEATTIITILKYDYWQKHSTTNRTANGQQTDSKRYTCNKNKNNKNVNNTYNREGGKITTPREDAINFFTSQTLQEQATITLVEKGLPENIAKDEISKFVSYWTEPTMDGKKQRWQKQETFEVSRRLATWCKNIKAQRTYKKSLTVV